MRDMRPWESLNVWKRKPPPMSRSPSLHKRHRKANEDQVEALLWRRPPRRLRSIIDTLQSITKSRASKETNAVKCSTIHFVSAGKWVEL